MTRTELLDYIRQRLAVATETAEQTRDDDEQVYDLARDYQDCLETILKELGNE